MQLELREVSRSDSLAQQLIGATQALQQQMLAMTAELLAQDEAIKDSGRRLDVRVTDIEHGLTGPGQHSSGKGPGKGGPQRLRIPDPNGWKLEVFKGKEDGFHGWRESFELQAGSIWLGLDR